MIDFQTLGKRLTEAGLTGKAVNEYSKEEVQTLVQACIDSLQPEKAPEWEKPSLDEDGTLHIPFNSDPKYHHWKSCGQSIYATLRELGASEEVFKNYVENYNKAPF